MCEMHETVWALEIIFVFVLHDRFNHNIIKIIMLSIQFFIKTDVTPMAKLTVLIRLHIILTNRGTIQVQHTLRKRKDKTFSE